MASQDVLAHAVAEEMQKVYEKELGPEPVPLTVPGEVINEEDVNFFSSIYLSSTRNTILLKVVTALGILAIIPCTFGHCGCYAQFIIEKNYLLS